MRHGVWGHHPKMTGSEKTIPWSPLGIASFTEGRGLWSAEGTGKGIRWGTYFSHRNPMAGDPSAGSGQPGRRRSQ